MAASSRHGQLQQGDFQTRASPEQAAAKRARILALHDAPSSLPNGEYFRARLEQALARDEPPYQDLTVFCISLNFEDFRPAIDACGREAGAEFLKSIAATLTAATRAEDMLGRLGRDEFVCLVPGMPKREQLSALAKKLLGCIPFPLRIGALQLCVRPSIGIAVYPRDGTSAEVLLSNAEFAMYRAKNLEAGYTFVDEG
ncbi:MAG: GGDEF domain-containing protein [Gammaproteobacteria bacterium]